MLSSMALGGNPDIRNLNLVPDRTPDAGGMDEELGCDGFQLVFISFSSYSSHHIAIGQHLTG